MILDINFGKSSWGMYCLTLSIFELILQSNFMAYVPTSDTPSSEIDVTTTENRASELIMNNKKSDAKQSILIIVLFFLLCN